MFKRPDDFNYEDRNYAINQYKEKYLNIKKLYDYASRLNVYDKVENVFELIGCN